MQSTSRNQIFIKELPNTVRAQEERSFLSKMIIFLTRIYMIQVTLDLKLRKADCSFFSLRTMIFFVVYVVGSIMIIAVFIPLFKEHYANMFFIFFCRKQCCGYRFQYSLLLWTLSFKSFILVDSCFLFPKP